MHKRMSNLVIIILVMVLLFGCSKKINETNSGNSIETLKISMAKQAGYILENGDSDYNLYKNMKWTKTLKALPSSFDLRNTGVVPEIRNQGNWGTCWGVCFNRCL